MNTYWMEQSLSDVPVYNEWLGEHELCCLEPLRIAKRREDWRLGRWTAKRAVTTVLGLPGDESSLRNVEVLADASGAPQLYIGRQPASVSLSLSHRAGVAACALAESTTALGCDLELIEPRSDAFIGDYFNEKEQAVIAKGKGTECDRLVTVLWSAKESVLKALRLGLTADTRTVNISFGDRNSKWDEQASEASSGLSDRGCSPGTWYRFQANFEIDRVLYGWWNTSAALVRTFATFSSAKPPILVTSKKFTTVHELLTRAR